MSNTLYALSTWRERNGKAPLREVAAAQAERLRAVHAPAAPRPLSPVQQRVAAVRAAAPTHTAPAPIVYAERPTYKQADELAASVPVGLYALPRTTPSASGNLLTFFKVHKFRGGHRIVQLVGSVGDYLERPLPVAHQVFALTHIAEDIAAAAALYGKEAKICGFCAARGRTSPLTHIRSLAAGYGEDCAKKYGLPW